MFALAAIVAVAADGMAASGRVLILHTNDLHDHVRPGYDGQGGLPYVSGYVQQVRSQRQDVLLLDAGDVAEKGDLVAARTNHLMTFQAMRRIGYDAVTIGNHDEDAGRDGLRRFEEALGQPLLCLNLLKPDGTPDFTPSRMFNIDGLRVAVIGMIVPRESGSLDFAASGRALEREAGRLDKTAHLIIALCHEGVEKCTEWSRLAPSVDVFVSGHSHEAIPSPVVVPETGARIVQAGCYANYVGRLEIVVDLDSEEITSADGELVPMRHDGMPVDQVMLDWIRAREQALCPEAAAVVAHDQAPVGLDIAWVAAEALRRTAGSDVAFCHPGQIIRSALPAGTVDVNAVYLTGGDRGDETVTTELTGAEIEAYLAALAARKDQTAWSGFVARANGGGGTGPGFATDLARDHRYTVILPELEWTTRFQRCVDAQRGHDPTSPLVARSFAVTPSKVTYTGAVAALLKEWSAQGREPAVEAARLVRSLGGNSSGR